MNYRMNFCKFVNFEIVVELIKIIFENKATIGYIPNNFNIAILIPIPKKRDIKKASESRPI